MENSNKALGPAIILLAASLIGGSYAIIEIENQHQETKLELNQLKVKYDGAIKEIDQLIGEKEQYKATPRKAKESGLTKKKALDYIEEYYAFYKLGMEYSNVKLKRIDANTFHVTIDDRETKEYSHIKELSLRNGKYYFSSNIMSY